MLSNFSFWIWGVIIAQFLTAFFHSLSFISKPKPANDTEKQLLDLMSDYKMNLGGGIRRSFRSIFTGVSVCFTLIYILGAAVNWYLVRSGISPEPWKGLLLIQVIVYGAVFLFQAKLTFWPPIIVTGLVFLFLAGSYLTIH
jgi:hypothetical protein